MRSSGSHVYIAQKPNKSGQILAQRWKIFFVSFTKLIPRRIFFVLQTFLVLMVQVQKGTRVWVCVCVCVPRSAVNNLGEIPPTMGAPFSFLKAVFLGREHFGTRPC